VFVFRGPVVTSVQSKLGDISIHGALVAGTQLLFIVQSVSLDHLKSPNVCYSGCGSSRLPSRAMFGVSLLTDCVCCTESRVDSTVCALLSLFRGQHSCESSVTNLVFCCSGCYRFSTQFKQDSLSSHDGLRFMQRNRIALEQKMSANYWPMVLGAQLQSRSASEAVNDAAGTNLTTIAERDVDQVLTVSPQLHLHHCQVLGWSTHLCSSAVSLIGLKFAGLLNSKRSNGME